MKPRIRVIATMKLLALVCSIVVVGTTSPADARPTACSRLLGVTQSSASCNFVYQGTPLRVAGGPNAAIDPFAFSGFPSPIGLPVCPPYPFPPYCTPPYHPWIPIPDPEVSSDGRITVRTLSGQILLTCQQDWLWSCVRKGASVAVARGTTLVCTGSGASLAYVACMSGNHR